MLCQDPEDQSGRSTSTPLLREVDVETPLQTVQAELPAYDIRVLNWHRPKRDYTPPDQGPSRVFS
jgi:hypothetical protein